MEKTVVHDSKKPQINQRNTFPEGIALDIWDRLTERLKVRPTEALL
jgi:hypothetical protein